jgi:hypothetical protein
MKFWVLIGSIYGVMLFVSSICSADYPQSTTTPLAVDLSMNQYQLKDAGDIITKGPWVDARAYNGGAFNDVTISQAVTGIGSAQKTLLLAPGTWTISANVIVPSNINLRFEQGAILSIGTGKEFKIYGPIDSPIVQIFSGSGKVMFGGSLPCVYAEWWGAVSDAATDCTNAIQSAIDAIETYNGGVVTLLIGIYKITAALKIQASGITIQGSGRSAIPHPMTRGGDITKRDATTIMYYGTTGEAIKINRDIATDIWTGDYTVPFVVLKDFNLIKYNTQNTDVTIGIKKVTRSSTFTNLTIAGFKFGCYSYSSWIDTWDNVEFSSLLNGGAPNDTCLYLEGQHNANQFVRCGFHWFRKGIVAAGDIGAFHIKQCTLEQNTGGGIWGTTNAKAITLGSTGPTGKVWINDCYFEGITNGDKYSIHVGDSSIGTGGIFVFADGNFFSNSTTATDVYVDYGEYYEDTSLHVFPGATIAKTSNGAYNIGKTLGGFQGYTGIQAANLGVGVTNSPTIAAQIASFGIQNYSLPANSTRYLEVDLGGDSTLGFLIWMGGAYNTTNGGYLLYGVYGSLNNNTIYSAGKVKISGSGTGTLGADVTINTPVAKGSGNIVRIPIQNTHASRVYTIHIYVLQAGSGSAMKFIPAMSQ